MNDLIERLEKATGPDRESDFAIHLALGLKASKSRRRDGQGSWWVYDAYDVCGYGLASLPDYTASIDAALMLVPDGWHWRLDQGRNAGAALFRDGFPQHFSVADTPALALCIAALKSRDAR